MADSGFSTDTWYQTIIRRTAAGGTEWYITQEGTGALNLVGADSNAPGDLAMIRLGADCNTDRLFRFDMANVKIYDDTVGEPLISRHFSLKVLVSHPFPNRPVCSFRGLLL